ncbi:SDR family oxidoreductase [Ruania zhangjianzhongii]|uniref:SDR family oxidoreductase n=1 Tax=Ruania zhangjianzhongii TaxID=2603206 RepID=UPI0011C7649B|nr:SDR family oxidoreductase [Ruania zhangjianzhongii]
MGMNILVTGGTGLLGRQVLPLLQQEDHTVRVLSRTAASLPDGVQHVAQDLRSSEGLDETLAGIDVVLHLAGGASGDDQTTQNLVTAAERQGAWHLVLISVTGADAMPIGYFGMKARAEQIVTDSQVPHTIVRVAQVNNLLLRAVRAMVKLPVVPTPGGLRAQPVDARDVAAHLAALTLAAPAGRVPDLVGPDVFEMGDLLRSYAEAAGKRRLFMPMRLPGKVGVAYREGRNLTPGVDATVAPRTWADFLAEQDVAGRRKQPQR